jgi:outer membrane protein assembly factor BamB
MRFVSARKRLLLGVAVLGALAALAVLLSGCGAGGSNSSDGSGGEPSEIPALLETPGFQDWPYFGRVPERTHYMPDNKIDRIDLDPPLKQAWSLNTHALIEFPPAIHQGVAYLINKYGNGKAVRLRDRKVLWELNLDRKNKGETPVDVTGPVYYKGKVYGAFLDGNLAAGDAATGKKVWVDDLHAHLESSPLAIEENLYIGTDKDQLLALDAEDGKKVWTFQAPGAIKASPSFDDAKVFVADYESAVFALDAKTGKTLWRTNTSMVPPGGKGGFFSSPSIAFGRVFAARDDGTVYAFDETTGKVDWAFPTGAAVYGSPAVAKVPGTPPTVYIGSENGTFYALDVRTGKPRWTYEVGGPIPGTATVIGHTAYTSSFQTQRTIGLDVLTHKKVFEIKTAGYTPVVSDGKRLYLVGYYTLVGLEPTHKSAR